MANLRRIGAVERYEPRLRHDQQPEGFVYLTAECQARFLNLGLAPGEEEAEPLPKEQAEVLLSRFCAGGDLVRGFDYERRGKRPMWLWKTRSLRFIGVYLDLNTFLIAGLEYKSAFGPKVTEEQRLRSVSWYASCHSIINDMCLIEYAWMGEDPHAAS